MALVTTVALVERKEKDNTMKLYLVSKILVAVKSSVTMISTTQWW